MATIYVDNQPHEVKDGQNLLHACLSLGFDLPFFCWHPAMHSVGACRQCAVKQFKDEKDTRGKIVMACMTPAADGTRISIDDPEAKKFRASITEWLMLNHPHDCPVCDEGGECHLQDMTVMTGHTYRRTRFRKRTYRNQDLGPFVTHEMNRCIQCYRCVRFYRDYAGGRDLDVFASHDDVYFGRKEEGPLESPFAGNLVEVCPTGVFTDKTLHRHYTRKWDLRTAPSVCIHCSLGCNTIPGERYGMLRRIRNRYNSAVNGYFLCDRGRYGYEFANGDKRIRHVLAREGKGAALREVAAEEAFSRLASLLASGTGAIGIGSPRASMEANFALKMLVGHERFFNGAAQKEKDLSDLVLRLLAEGPVRTPTLAEVATADAVLILGEDVLATAPVLGLNVRQAAKQKPMEVLQGLKIHRWDANAVKVATEHRRGPLFIATPFPTELDDKSVNTYRGTPGRLAALGRAIAEELDGGVDATGLDGAFLAFAREAAAELGKARQPLILSGCASLSSEVIRSAARIAAALHRKGKNPWLSYALPECNSMGTAMLGARGIGEALRVAGEGRADTLIVLENDLFTRADPVALSRFLDSFKHVVVIDHVFTRTTDRADVVLPSAPWAEADGTLVNNEGRAQRFFQVFPPASPVKEAWRWIGELMAAAGRPEAAFLKNFDALNGAVAASDDLLSRIAGVSPPAGHRIVGMKIARQHYRSSGRTAIDADRTVHEPQPPADPDSCFSFSMEGYEGTMEARLAPRFWAPGWNSTQSVLKFQDGVNGPLRGGDAGIRLIEPGGTDPLDRPQDLETPQDADNSGTADPFLLLPVPAVFGTEELSAHAPAVAARTERPYLLLSEKDAEALGCADGDRVELFAWDCVYDLPARVDSRVAPGVGGVCCGPGMAPVLLCPSVRLKAKK